MARATGKSSGVTVFRYLSRLHDTILSRADVEIEALDVPHPAQAIGRLTGRLKFSDGSLLEFVEQVRPRGKRGVEKISYSYHYQHADGRTVFRYDNSPHHPEIANTFPRHKHSGDQVEAADSPDLHDVLQEIDQHLRS